MILKNLLFFLMKIILFAFIILFSVIVPVLSDEKKPSSGSLTNDWKKEIIYLAMIDRFFDGDQSNNQDVEKGNLYKHQGGDFQGIINKMGYLKNLGITALWITPIFKNQYRFINSIGYHGYWPVDLYKTDPHFGDTEKFKEMVKVAHNHGIKVLLDITLNHFAWEHPFVNEPDKYSWFHHGTDIFDWNDIYQTEYYTMYGLPDLAQENPDVYKYLLDASKYWIKTGQLDGFRLDAAKHIPHWFWQKFTKEIFSSFPDFFMIGEVFDKNPKVIAKYQDDKIPSLFDIPLYYAVCDSIAKGNSMKILGERIQELNKIYKNPGLMASFIDNHDTDRFITCSDLKRKEKLKLAISFLMTINRIPTIYYGTESLMYGHLEKDSVYPPENRAMMVFNKDPDMELFIKTLINLRKSSKSLSYGSFVPLFLDNSIFAFSRKYKEEETIVILNNSDTFMIRTIQLCKEKKSTSKTLVDYISGKRIIIKNNKITVKIEAYQALIFSR